MFFCISSQTKKKPFTCHRIVSICQPKCYDMVCHNNKRLLDISIELGFFSWELLTVFLFVIPWTLPQITGCSLSFYVYLNIINITSYLRIFWGVVTTFELELHCNPTKYLYVMVKCKGKCSPCSVLTFARNGQEIQVESWKP